MKTTIDTGHFILNYLINEPWISNVVFLAINIAIYGLNGFLGGYLPIRIEIGGHVFYTMRKNAFNSERLTRIVQQKYYAGHTIDDKVRKEILDKYGPQKHGQQTGKRKTNVFTCHYRDVIINQDYFKHNIYQK